jgi:hypothetical protein
MQIDEIGIGNCLYENNNNNNLSLKRHLSMPLYLGWVSQSDDLQLMKHKFVLSKPNFD